MIIHVHAHNNNYLIVALIVREKDVTGAGVSACEIELLLLSIIDLLALWLCVHLKLVMFLHVAYLQLCYTA